MAYSKEKAFTLIELLFVLAIIGVLVTIIFAGLNIARMNNRDAKRLSDIRTIHGALFDYFETNKTFPIASNTCDPANNQFFGLEALVTAGSISVLPRDPAGGANGVCYAYATPTNAGTQFTFHLGASLEGTPSALDNDIDCYSNNPGGTPPNSPCVGGVVPWSGAPLNGDDGGKCDASHFGSHCYDRIPE
ncbi:MAG TPA: type II secretion system protein [Candidatus Paceibacterota bacterium]